MYLALQLASWVIGLSLGVMTMSAMLRGQWRHYPFVFLWVMGDFVTTIVEIRPGLNASVMTAAERKSFSFLYWLDERIMQALVFILVISLIYRAAAHLKTRNILVAGAVCSILLFAGATFFMYYDPSVTTGKWITPWLRNLNFSAAILDLGLWALLIGARRKDYKLLMVSGALGIQFTAGAIGQALRYLSHSTVELTGYLISASNLVCMYILWQAFRNPPERKPPANPLPSPAANTKPTVN